MAAPSWNRPIPQGPESGDVPLLPAASVAETLNHCVLSATFVLDVPPVPVATVVHVAGAALGLFSSTALATPLAASFAAQVTLSGTAPVGEIVPVPGRATFETVPLGASPSTMSTALA